MRAPERGVALAALAALALLPAAGWLADARSQTPRKTRQPPTVARLYADTLPEAPGREIAGRACLMCHSASMLTQQRKDSTAWDKTLAQMRAWGAPLSEGERDTLRDYLVARFGPRP